MSFLYSEIEFCSCSFYKIKERKWSRVSTKTSKTQISTKKKYLFDNQDNIQLFKYCKNRCSVLSTTPQKHEVKMRKVVVLVCMHAIPNDKI
jgi:hypothetical protein